MLHDDDEVAFRREPAERVEQPVDILEPEAARRLVEKYRGTARVRLGEKPRQTEPLPLARGESSGLLAEVEVGKADLGEGLERSRDALSPANHEARAPTGASRTSVRLRPSTRQARTSSENRRPPQASQPTDTSGRRSIATATMPRPTHVSQRPPGELDENAFAVSLRARASGVAAKRLRSGSATPASFATVPPPPEAGASWSVARTATTGTWRSSARQPTAASPRIAARSEGARTSRTSVDLPLPETPATTTSPPDGISTSTFFSV